MICALRAAFLTGLPCVIALAGCQRPFDEPKTIEQVRRDVPQAAKFHQVFPDATTSIKAWSAGVPGHGGSGHAYHTEAKLGESYRLVMRIGILLRSGGWEIIYHSAPPEPRHWIDGGPQRIPLTQEQFNALLDAKGDTSALEQFGIKLE